MLEWVEYDFLQKLYNDCFSEAKIKEEFWKVPFEVAFVACLSPKLDELLGCGWERDRIQEDIFFQALCDYENPTS